MNEFVVEVDQRAVARARATTLSTLAVAAVSSLVGGGLIVGLSVAMVVGTRLYMFGAMAAPGLVLGYDGIRRLARRRRLRDMWAATGIAPVAMRFTVDGLRCGTDAAPDSIFLPWNTVAGLHLATWRGQQSLVIDLMPGVTPATPGVRGLEHPDVQRVLHHAALGTKGLRVATRVLRQPVPMIDRALASFTAGRVRVR